MINLGEEISSQPPRKNESPHCSSPGHYWLNWHLLLLLLLSGLILPLQWVQQRKCFKVCNPNVDNVLENGIKKVSARTHHIIPLCPSSKLNAAESALYLKEVVLALFKGMWLSQQLGCRCTTETISLMGKEAPSTSGSLQAPKRGEGPGAGPEGAPRGQ